MMVILSRTLDTIYAIGRFDDKRLPIKIELHNSCIRIDIFWHFIQRFDQQDFIKDKFIKKSHIVSIHSVRDT
jgi:hypothetical protein